MPAPYCPRCGQPIGASDQRFCRYCGAALVAIPPAPPATFGPAPVRIGGTSAQHVLLLAAIAVVVLAAVGAVVAFALSAPGGFSGIRVLAPTGGCWNGAISGPGSMTSVDGCGPKDYRLTCGGPAMGAIQKDDAGSWTLTVEILSNGHIVQQSSTSSPYGGASVVGTC